LIVNYLSVVHYWTTFKYLSWKMLSIDIRQLSTPPRKRKKIWPNSWYVVS